MRHCPKENRTDVVDFDIWHVEMDLRDAVDEQPPVLARTRAGRVAARAARYAVSEVVAEIRSGPLGVREMVPADEVLLEPRLAVETLNEIVAMRSHGTYRPVPLLRDARVRAGGECTAA